MDGGARAAGIVWTADAELPQWQEWASISAQNAGQVERVTSPRAQGRYAWKFTIIDGVAGATGDPSNAGPYAANPTVDERVELGMSERWLPGTFSRDQRFMRNREFQQGQVRWVSWQVYMPAEFNHLQPSWQTITQFKGGLTTNGPAIEMSCGYDGYFALGIIPNNNPTSFADDFLWDADPAPLKGQWLRFTIGAKFHTDPSVGWVEFWGDLGTGTMQQLVARQTRSTMKTEPDPRIQFRCGIYRDQSQTGSYPIYFDGITAATSRAAAERNAFRGLL